VSLRADIETAANAKVSKKEANYSAGLPSAHCSICRHFEPPHACEIVRGEIDPDLWCRYFSPKKRKP